MAHTRGTDAPPRNEITPQRQTRNQFGRVWSLVNRHRFITFCVVTALAIGSLFVLLGVGSSSGASLISVPASYSTIRQEISLTGNIEPATNLGLNFATSGIVNVINVTAGQKVRAGTLLASLNTSAQLAQLVQDQDALNVDKASLREAKAAAFLNQRLNATSLTLTQLAVVQDQHKLSSDQTTLNQDRAIARNWCHADAASSECVQARQALADDQSTIQADQQNIATDQLGIGSTRQKNTQSVDAASSQVAQDQTNLSNARNQLAENETNAAYDQSTLCPITPNPCTSQNTLNQQEQAVNASELSINSATTSLAAAQTALLDVQVGANITLAQSQLLLTNASQKLSADEAVVAVDARIASGGCPSEPSSTECNAAQNAITGASQSVAADRSQLVAELSQPGATQLRNAQVSQQSRNQITADQSQIVAQEATITNDELAVSNSEIIAPINGTVAQVNVVAGHSDAGAAAATPEGAIVLSSTGGYQVQISVSDAQIAQVKLGEQAIVVPTGSTSSVYGTVTQITPQATIGSGVATFPVTVSITNAATYPPTTAPKTSAPPLFAGASAQVTLVVREATNVLSVPTSAVHTIGSRNFVFIPYKNREKKTTILVGATDPLRTQVISGLKSGQLVVIVNTKLAVPNQSGGLGFGTFGGGHGKRGGRGKG